MKLLENKKFIAIVLVLNCIVICILISYLVRAKMEERSTESQSQTVDSSDTVSFSQSDEDLASIYMSLLWGSHFDLDNDIHFCFDESGEYSGFFDSENPDVKGYSYYINVSDGTVYLEIYNKDKSKVVQYEVSFDQEDNIILKHPNMETPITLSY